jgi:hypothetical protein
MRVFIHTGFIEHFELMRLKAISLCACSKLFEPIFLKLNFYPTFKAFKRFPLARLSRCRQGIVPV